MKKHILALAFSIISIGTFAQTIRYGLKAGFNSAKFVTDNDTYSPYNNKKYTGFSFGGIIDIGFGDFTLQPGLLFTANSLRDHAPITPGGTLSTTPQVKYYLNYLQVPVNLLVNIEIAKPLKMQLGGGPYFAFKTGSDNYSYEAYTNSDIGINLFAGFVLANKYLLNAQYGFGESDITKGGEVHNRVMSISVGYLFK
jgi:hypothetical protein